MCRLYDIELACRNVSRNTNRCIIRMSFPHGTTLSEIKAPKLSLYSTGSVDEIDMVVNYSYIRSKLWQKVEDDIKAVTDIAKAEQCNRSSDFETSKLTKDRNSKGN